MDRLKQLTPLLVVAATLSACWKTQPIVADHGDTDTPSSADTDTDIDTDTDADIDSDTDQSFWDTLDTGFRTVWGRGTDDVWFGGVNTPLLHWDGVSLQSSDLGFHWVFSIEGSPSETYFAGVGLSDLPDVPPVDPWPVVARYNAPYWEEEWSGDPGVALLAMGMAGDDTADTYAVGMGTTIVHKTGDAWTPVDESVLWWEERSYHSVWVDSGDLVFVGGARDSCEMGVTYACGGILRFNGTSWSEMVVPSVNWGIMHIPLDMVRTEDGVLWVAASTGVVYRIGDTWTDSYALFDGDLRGVWARQADDVWVVGEGGAMAQWDGVSWTTWPQDETIRFYDVWGNDTTTGMDGWANDVYAVGGVLDEGLAEWMPIIMHFDGFNWMVIYPYGA